MDSMTAEERAFWDWAAVAAALQFDGVPGWKAEMGARTADALLAERCKRVGAASVGVAEAPAVDEASIVVRCVGCGRHATKTEADRKAWADIEGRRFCPKCPLPVKGLGCGP